MEQSVEGFRHYWDELDVALATLPEQIRGQAGIAALMLILFANSMGTLSRASNASKSRWAPEIGAEVNAERQRNAGKRSGEVRKEKRPWAPVATVLAKKIRQKHPRFSQEKVAVEIEFLWPADGVAAPSQGTLKEFVSELEMSGTIARRIK